MENSRIGESPAGQGPSLSQEAILKALDTGRFGEALKLRAESAALAALAQLPASKGEDRFTPRAGAQSAQELTLDSSRRQRKVELSPSSEALAPSWLTDFTSDVSDRASSTNSLPSTDGTPSPAHNVAKKPFRSSSTSGIASPLSFASPPSETPYFPRTLADADRVVSPKRAPSHAREFSSFSRGARSTSSASLNEADLNTPSPPISPRRPSSRDFGDSYTRSPSRGAGSPSRPSSRGRKSAASFSEDDTIPERTVSSPNPRSPSRPSLRRNSSVRSLTEYDWERSSSSSPAPSPSRGRGSPARPLSRNSRSFASARPVTAPPPAASGEAPQLKKGLFFPEGILFTRCLTGDLRPDQIKSISGPNKDAFITTTEDYEQVGIGVTLPDRDTLITQNDPDKLITTLSLNDTYEDSVKSNGVWFITIGLGAKIAVPTNRKSETYQKFQEVGEDAQCGLTASTGSREWVMGEDDKFFKKDVRSGHIKIYKIEASGTTEQWSFAGPGLMPLSAIQAIPVRERGAMARQASAFDDEDPLLDSTF